MHFLDATRFNTILGLIRSNSAYSVVTNPATQRPHIEFTTSTVRACGTTGLSCVLYNNIYGTVVNRPSAVHSLATGLGTSSPESTRDWLMTNILRGTDDFTFNVAANMTDLVRRNFDINDRYNRAWFVNPGNRWNIPLSGGAQSNLLLSDRLIMFAVITLNDGEGKVMRRRLMSFSPSPDTADAPHMHEDRMLSPAMPAAGGRSLLSIPPIQSDDAIMQSALQQISSTPRVGTLPPFSFNVNIPEAIAGVYGVEQKKYSLLTIEMQGKVPQISPYATDMESVGSEIYRRLLENKDKYCPDCESIFPAFANILQVVGNNQVRNTLGTYSTCI